MSSTNKTSLGLNKWEASDKPVRQDFVNDNVIIDTNLAKWNTELAAQKLTSLTKASPDVDLSAVSIYRYGRLVVGSFRLKFTEAQTQNGYKLLTTLPAGYRPTKTVYLNVIGNSGNSQSCYVNADGELYYYVSTATVTGENFTIGCNFGIY